MRLKYLRRWITHPNGQKQLDVSVVNAATGEPIEGLSFVAVETPIGTSPERLVIHTTMFGAPPDETVVIIEKTVTPPVEAEPPTDAVPCGVQS